MIADECGATLSMLELREYLRGVGTAPLSRAIAPLPLPLPPPPLRPSPPISADDDPTLLEWPYTSMSESSTKSNSLYCRRQRFLSMPRFSTQRRSQIGSASVSSRAKPLLFFPHSC